MKKFHDFNLKDYNSFKIDAVCRNAYFPDTIEDVVEIYAKVIDKDDIIVIGEGNNIILEKEYYDKDFIIFNNSFNAIHSVGGQNLICQAGVSLKKLSEYAMENSLGGLEIFYDIPSSLGGAIVMNAGAYGIEIKDYIVSVKCLNSITLEVENYKLEDLNYSYRTSVFQQRKELIVLEVELHLLEGISSAIHEKMLEIKADRWRKQPRNYPNAGSVFKRPVGHYVGQIIEELGLKGTTAGGAQVSEKHGGFIINVNNAKGSDIVKLIDLIQNKVYNKYGFKLEVEQRII